MKKYVSIVERFLFYIPFFMFILYTTVNYAYASRTNSELVLKIIGFFNQLFLIGPYIFLIMALILAIYIMIKGNSKQIIITVITFLGCFFTFHNVFTFKNDQAQYLTSLLFVATYLLGIYYTIALFIYLKDKEFKQVKKKFIAGIKTIVYYVGIIYLIALLSNTNVPSYSSTEHGLSGWFKSTNGFGHAFVFLLPLFVSLYIKDKGYKYLFYIIVIGLIDLLISTKACYYGLISTVIVGIIYLIIDFITKRKYHYFKMVSLIILLITALSISNNFYVTENIKQNIERNTNNQGWVDVVNFVISGRDRNVRSIEPYFFKESDIFTKLFGIGLYYPLFEFIYVELDLLDLLFSRGIYGFLLYVIFFGGILIKMCIRVFKNVKNNFDVDVIFMFLTLGYIGFASIFVGHVLFNLMPLTVAIMVIIYYMYEFDKRLEKPKKAKHKSK